MKQNKVIKFKCPTCGCEETLSPDDDFFECLNCLRVDEEQELKYQSHHKIVPTIYYRNPMYKCKDGTLLKYEDAIKTIDWLDGGYFGANYYFAISKRKNGKITGKLDIFSRDGDSETNYPYPENNMNKILKTLSSPEIAECIDVGDKAEFEKFLKEMASMSNNSDSSNSDAEKMKKIDIDQEWQKLLKKVIKFLFYKIQVQSFQAIAHGCVCDVSGGLKVEFVDGKILNIDIQDLYCNEKSSLNDLFKYFRTVIKNNRLLSLKMRLKE